MDLKTLEGMDSDELRHFMKEKENEQGEMTFAQVVRNLRPTITQLEKYLIDPDPGTWAERERQPRHPGLIDINYRTWEPSKELLSQLDVFEDNIDLAMAGSNKITPTILVENLRWFLYHLDLYKSLVEEVGEPPKELQKEPEKEYEEVVEDLDVEDEEEYEERRRARQKLYDFYVSNVERYKPENFEKHKSPFLELSSLEPRGIHVKSFIPGVFALASMMLAFTGLVKIYRCKKHAQVQ